MIVNFKLIRVEGYEPGNMMDSGGLSVNLQLTLYFGELL